MNNLEKERFHWNLKFAISLMANSLVLNSDYLKKHKNMESPVYDIYIFGLHVEILTVPDHCLQLLSAQRIHRLLCVANNKHQPLQCTLDMISNSRSSAGLSKTEADLLYPLPFINSGLKANKQTKYKATHTKTQRIQLIVGI